MEWDNEMPHLLMACLMIADRPRLNRSCATIKRIEGEEEKIWHWLIVSID